jgi:hypothetical protein
LKYAGVKVTEEMQAGHIDTLKAEFSRDALQGLVWAHSCG